MRSNIFVRVLLVFTLSILMSSCAKLNSIYRAQLLPENSPHLVSIDAKQRVVLTNPGKASDKDILRFCAEPPPDVFTALASSLGAEGSFSSEAGSKEAAAKLAATLSENAATIERTQTVNVLRESMYRNCERYMSGAIGKDEFIIQAARDQQLIVQVMAVEQITGVAKSQATALTTTASAVAGGVTSDATLETLTNAKKDLDTKRKANTEAKAAANTQAPSVACGNPIDETKPPSGVTAEDAKAKNAKCVEASKTAQQLKEAEEFYQLVSKAVAKQGTVNSETLGALASAASEASAASKEIAEKVVEIVRQYQAFDEIGMSCVVILRNGGDSTEYCEKLLKSMAEKREAQLKLEVNALEQEALFRNAKSVKDYREIMDKVAKSEAEIVWEALGPNFSASSLQALLDKSGVRLSDARRKRLFAANKNFPAFLKIFKRVSPKYRQRLARVAL